MTRIDDIKKKVENIEPGSLLAHGTINEIMTQNGKLIVEFRDDIQWLIKEAERTSSKLEIAQKALEESASTLNEIRDTKCSQVAKRVMEALDQLKE